MGNSCNPKPQPLIPPKKETLEYTCKKIKIHLELKQSRINDQIISGEGHLVQMITVADKNKRNKYEQLLLAERVVNGLKYTAVYTILLDYAQSMRTSASFICQNANNEAKLQPWQHKIYSMLYASQVMPISSLQDFQKCMEYFHFNEILMDQFTDKQIKQYLTPQPTPQQMNIYILEMAERNHLDLKKINEAGHNFSKKGGSSSNFDPEFRQKSEKFRNSLPKNELHGYNQNIPQSSNRKSVRNPFDKHHDVQSKPPINQGQKIDQKLNENDISPNITDLMKKIDEASSRRSTYKGY